jgi:hypothetical protein
MAGRGAARQAMRDDIIWDNIGPLSEKGKQSMEWLSDILFPPMLPIEDEAIRAWLDYITRNSVESKDELDE